MKKFVCLYVPKPNSITRLTSDLEHPIPLVTFPRGAGYLKFNTLSASAYFVIKYKSRNFFY